MADVRHPKDQPLKAGQLGHPVVETERIINVVDKIAYIEPPYHLFGHERSQRLITWGRDPEDPKFTAHWIGVRSGTPLHTDPRYPRYTHQLVVGIDDGFLLTGFDGQLTLLPFGTYVCVDSHSPHRLVGRTGNFYVAASLDAHFVIHKNEAIRILWQFISGRGRDVYVQVSGDAPADGG